ncbi:MAG: hypothetical protein AB8H86_22230 [Polyangiales bacterium]
MSELDYGALIAAGAKMWLTAGPNSGGVEGLLLHEDKVYRFVADWDARILGGAEPVAEFVRKHAKSDTRGIAELIAYVAGPDN